MEPGFDPYRVLGVALSASFDEIRDAFRQRAKACHPDMGGSHESMVYVLEAWQILSDKDKRKLYDAAHSSGAGKGDSAAWSAVADAVHEENESYPEEREKVPGWIDELIAKAEAENEVARLRRQREENEARAKDKADRKRHLKNPGDTAEEITNCFFSYVHRIPLEPPEELIQICEAAVWKLRRLAVKEPGLSSTAADFEKLLTQNSAKAKWRERWGMLGTMLLLASTAVFVVILVKSCGN